MRSIEVKYSPASAVEEGALAGLAVAEALADPAVVAFRLADSLEAGPAPADSLEAADPREDPDIARNKKEVGKVEKMLVNDRSVQSTLCPYPRLSTWRTSLSTRIHKRHKVFV